MNQQLMSQLLSELPTHLALFLCGAIGYLLTKWANRRFITPRNPPWHVKLDLQEEEEALAQPAEPRPSVEPGLPVQRLQGPGVKSCRRGRARKSRATPRTAAASVLRADAGEAEAPATGEAAEAEAAREEAREAALAGSEEAAEAEAGSEGAELALPEAAAAGATPVSDRIARLLVKKAQRKARKAKQEQCAEDREAAVASTAADPEGRMVPEPSPTTLRQIEHRLPREAFQEPAHVFDLQKHNKVWDNPCKEQDMDLVEQVELQPRAAKIDPLKSSTSSKAIRLDWGMESANEDELEKDWVPQRLLALDARLDDEQLLGCTTDDEVEDEGDAFWAEAGDCDEEGRAAWAWTAPCQDGWMLPFDDLLNRPDGPEYSPCNAVEFIQPAYQPVLSAHGQQLYRDGEQLYMLACLDTLEDQETATGAPPLLHAVVDPLDPMHGVVMDHCSRLASAVLRDLCVAPVPEAPEYVQAPTDELWGVCWDFTL